MKHVIEKTRGLDAGSHMVWDDEAGTVVFENLPEPPDGYAELLQEYARTWTDYMNVARHAPIPLYWPRHGKHYNVDNAAHDPADFLLLLYYDGGRAEGWEKYFGHSMAPNLVLPPSLANVVPTAAPPALPEPPPGETY